MSQKELSRLEVMQLIKERRLRQIQAVDLLHVNLRHVKRIYKQYKQAGASGLISNRRGKPSNHKLPNNVKELCLALIEKHYYDFGPTLATEKLGELHDIHLSTETVRKLMIDNHFKKFLFIPPNINFSNR